MSIPSRREYLARLQPRYLTAPKLQKTELLDEVCTTTGLDRKHCIHLLHARTNFTAKRQRAETPKRRIRRYGNDVTYWLKKVWDILDCPCGQRLAPALRPTIDALLRHREMVIPGSVQLKLRMISPSTCDRLLKPWRAQRRRTLHGSTKPGSLLKRQIPIQLSRWDIADLGHSEIDLVAHNGGHGDGEFAYTRTDTDLKSGWTELEAILGKAQGKVIRAMQAIGTRRPFPRKSIDSDTGSEFINWNLFRWCEAEGVTFTRGRPGKKNDNAHVEQKNWTHVRKLVGYHRYATAEHVDRLNDLYRHEWRQYENFFQPTIKLAEKVRTGGHVRKVYEVAKTPYQRIMESAAVDEGTKHRLREQYHSLNPAALKRTIEQKVDRILQTVKQTPRIA